PLRPMGRYLDLLCMGAAFLLLETKNVVQFALLFGTTWFVNSLVFTGILIAVYLAIEVARRVELGPSWRLYLALVVALAVAWLVQPELLLRLSIVPRFVVAIVIAFAPVFLANLVFARRFRDVAASNLAFAADLRHGVRLIAVGDRNGHPRVALEVARFARSRACQEHDSVALEPDPDGDAVRTAVGQHGGHVGDVRAVQQDAHFPWQACHNSSIAAVKEVAVRSFSV